MDNETNKMVMAKFEALMKRSEENPELKSEVLKTIELFENVGAFVDLFTTKYASVQGDYLKNILNKE